MVQRIFRYIFILVVLGVACSVVLEQGSFKSMLPTEYNLLERLYHSINSKMEPVRPPVEQRTLPRVEPTSEEINKFHSDTFETAEL